MSVTSVLMSYIAGILERTTLRLQSCRQRHRKGLPGSRRWTGWRRSRSTWASLESIYSIATGIYVNIFGILMVTMGLKIIIVFFLQNIPSAS